MRKVSFHDKVGTFKVESILQDMQPEEYEKLKSRCALSKPLEIIENLLDRIVDPIIERVIS